MSSARLQQSTNLLWLLDQSDIWFSSGIPTGVDACESGASGLEYLSLSYPVIVAVERPSRGVATRCRGMSGAPIWFERRRHRHQQGQAPHREVEDKGGRRPPDLPELHP